jgi:SH3-like domain-containing protein
MIPMNHLLHVPDTPSFRGQHSGDFRENSVDIMRALYFDNAHIKVLRAVKEHSLPRFDPLFLPQRVNVRALPSGESAVLFQLTQGEVLRLIEEKGDWLLVEGPGSRRGYLRRTLAELPSPPLAPRAASASAGEAVFSNSDVISLVQVKLSDSVIIAKIQQVPSPRLDLTTEGLIALKRASVSDAVIQAMLTRASHVASTPGARSEPSAARATTVTEHSKAATAERLKTGHRVGPRVIVSFLTPGILVFD